MTSTSWADYHDTNLRFTHNGVDITFVMRNALTPEQLEQLAKCVGGPGEFAVITAFNPNKSLSDDANFQAHARLIAHVQSQGLKFIEAHGVAATPAAGAIPHQELGVAIRTSKNNARSIAELFVQNAFFWFDGANFWIEPACKKTPAARV
jgi:hypothetical protein